MSTFTRFVRSASGSAATLSAVSRAMSSVVSESSARMPASFGLAGSSVPVVRRDPAERNVQWVFLGCPGVGKGTYASRLSQFLGVPHIATGDLVREELSSAGPLAGQLAEIVNRGKLVPDEFIIDLLSKRLERGEANGESGFILDGFPRTIKQAEILEGIMDIDLVVNLKLREEVLIEKCLGRRICSQCGKNFNVASIHLKGENGRPGISMAPLPPPPQCASKLITRADDSEDVVKERLRVYHDLRNSIGAEENCWSLIYQGASQNLGRSYCKH
ncbi:probable adenylate kinase 1, chloroplastic isoform X2 [Phalaenopsis equestris]|uniref:probable adenylate kinase 1, chloroplastic isoform X2 n=1 Tax=Phalaenopsis equestris TaxID=78828 RepID=UPI0009E58944|nr:probable adenylate kinase 1, chloroplastic isoform X2 [Phalaenopsis equestris]